MTGIALQFGAQSFALDRWLAPGRAPMETFASYNAIAAGNLAAKLGNHLAFFADIFPTPTVLVFVVLGVLLSCAVWRARSQEP